MSIYNNPLPVFDPRQLAKWTNGLWRFGMPEALRGVSTDTRTLVKDNLFVALKGPCYDGHDFIGNAFENGAAGAVVCDGSIAQSIFKTASSGFFPLLCVENPASALCNMASCYRRESGIKVIAVTGSVGKTTVKEMVADVLSKRIPTARTRGNWNNDIGLPLSILSMKPAAEIGVFELGTNHPGELEGLCRQLAPNWGLITPIGPVHLEFFESVEAIAVEKSDLLRNLPDNGVAVLKKDEQYYDILRSAAPCRVVTIARKGDADYSCVSKSCKQGKACVVERATGESFSFKLPLPGEYIIINALYAIAVGREHGLEWEDIRLSLEQYKALPMRWECLSVAGVTVINDAYNANPLNMQTSLQTFADYDVKGRKWLVFAGMHELGEFESHAHISLGNFIAKGEWARLLTIGPLGTMIADSAEQAGMKPDNILRCTDHEEAARILSSKTSDGDAVLLKASRAEHLEYVLELWIKLQHGKA